MNGSTEKAKPPAPTPQSRSNGVGGVLLAAAWRPTALAYLAFCLAGLAAGIWPGAIYPSRADVLSAPLPALRTLAVAQAAFILLVYPLVAGARAARCDGRYWPGAVVESLALLAAAAPFYLAGAFLADATAVDAVRTAICVGTFWPAAWLAGWMLRRPGARTVTVLALLVVTLGLPAGYYLVLEFLPVYSAEWLWRLGPLTFAWETASSRRPDVLPSPAWAMLVWPVVAAVAAGVAALAGRQR